MKKLLYIHHSFQNKTKSNHFLRELLQSQYDVEFLSFDPSAEKFPFKKIEGKNYDVLILFQVMPSIDKLKKYLHFEHGVFFPMYDAAPERDNPLWYEYRDFHIINFSGKLHEELLALDFDCHYFQYFPKPAEPDVWGNEKSLFFWQRRDQININTIEQIINTHELEHIHLHNAPDPACTFVEPRKTLAQKCSFSTWFEHKEDLIKVMQKSALYFAPREYEGIGMSFLDAMAMGRCVIAPNNSTMNEYIVHNQTGFLYDFAHPKQITVQNVQQIQKNTYEYIKNGYEEWERKKFDIFNILESSIKQSVNREKFFKPLEIAGRKIPFMTVLNFSHKKKYRLFNCLTLFKTTCKKNLYKFYLFDFILLFSIEKEI